MSPSSSHPTKLFIAPSSAVGERFAPLMAAHPEFQSIADPSSLGKWLAEQTSHWSSKDWKKVLPLDISMLYSAWIKPRLEHEKRKKMLIDKIINNVDQNSELVWPRTRKVVWNNVFENSFFEDQDVMYPSSRKNWSEPFEEVDYYGNKSTDSETEKFHLLKSFFTVAKEQQFPVAALLKFSGFVRAECNASSLSWWNTHCYAWFEKTVTALPDDEVLPWIKDHRECFFGWELQAQRPLLAKLLSSSNPSDLQAALEIRELNFFGASAPHVVDRVFEEPSPHGLLQSIQASTWVKKMNADQLWGLLQFLGGKVEQVPATHPASSWFVDLSRHFLSTASDGKIKSLVSGSSFQQSLIKPLLARSPSVLFETLDQSELSDKAKNMVWERILRQPGKDANQTALFMARNLPSSNLLSFLSYVCRPSNKKTSKDTDFGLVNAILQHRSSEEATSCMLALMAQHFQNNNCQFLSSLCQRQDLDNQIDAGSPSSPSMKRKL